MILSKFFCKIKIDNDLYAIFNNLIMDVFFVSKKELNAICSLQVDSKDMISELFQSGIYCKTQLKDDLAIKHIQNEYVKTEKRIELLYLIVSQGCNLGCRYCFLENDSGNWKNEHMSIDTMTTAIVQFNKYVIENKIKKPRIMFFGGEPLINWSVVKAAVELAESLFEDISFSIVTNGTLIDEEKAKFFKKHNIGVGISLDGPKAINDENRIYKNTDKSVYDQVLSNIEYLKKESCDMGLSITLTEALLKNSDKVIKWLIDLNFPNIFFNLFHYSCYCSNWEKLYNDSVDFLINAYTILGMSGITEGRVYRQFESLALKKLKLADCAAIGLNQLVIKPDGEVRVCQCDYENKFNHLGNIHEETITMMVEKGETKNWLNKVPIMTESCMSCESLFFCGGGCLLQAEALFGSIDEIDKSYCVYSRKILSFILKESYNHIK